SFRDDQDHHVRSRRSLELWHGRPARGFGVCGTGVPPVGSEFVARASARGFGVCSTGETPVPQSSSGGKEMKYVENIKSLLFGAALILAAVLSVPSISSAQSTAPAIDPVVAPSPAPAASPDQANKDQANKDQASKNRPRKATDKSKEESAKPAQESPAGTTSAVDIPADMQANRLEQTSEENAVVPYYNNFFTTYRLGPEDVISVSVFGQDRYSRSGIIVPPSGRISLALVPGGLFVNG